MPAQLLSRVSLIALSLVSATLAQTTLPPPGQPKRNNAPLGSFEIVGDSVVSAQQLFLGTLDKVYIVDKVERNPTQIAGHPAWAAEYSMTSNKGRAMDVVTNSFCAGGNVLGNGTWINVGGNQAVTYGGLGADSQTGGGPYDDPDGRQSTRLLNPCDDGKCDWFLAPDMTTRRWYPTVETLEDGRAMIIGGCFNGGYVNDAGQSNPTYEFFPATPGAAGVVTSPFLQRTLPTNLFPLTWLLPSGKIFMQANWATTLIDYHTNKEFALPDMPHAVRTYPASAGTTIMPLTPANNWTATILFCGGTDLKDDQWKPTWPIVSYKASTSCVRISPDTDGVYVEDDDIPEARAMGNIIMLPDQKLLLVNGAGTGTAGYGNDTWAVGQSYADDPVMSPVIYDPAAPAGKRWSRDGLSASTVPRMYHSGGTILPDGSVFISGSNPNADFNPVGAVKYPTEYRVEVFYPPYYNSRRPSPSGILSQLGYGGDYFNLTLSKDDLFGDVNNAKTANVVIIRPGFSTHTMNMGQRLIQLENTYTINKDGSMVMHVSQLPPNPAIFVPGPALLFVVVNGVPSMGVQVMIGSGQLGDQKLAAVAPLPATSSAIDASSSSNSTGGSKGQANAAPKSLGFSLDFATLALPLLLAAWTSVLAL